MIEIGTWKDGTAMVWWSDDKDAVAEGLGAGMGGSPAWTTRGDGLVAQDGCFSCMCVAHGYRLREMINGRAGLRRRSVVGFEFLAC